MDNVESKAVKACFCKKGLSAKEIHDNIKPLEMSLFLIAW